MNKQQEKNSFYEFDDNNKEVVFKRYDMPSPWMNFLSNGEFFTMISQAGGNLSWYKSPELEIKPCLPSHVKHATVKREFRGCTYNIEIYKEGYKAIKKFIVNGIEQSGYSVPHSADSIIVQICM